eukprot:CAMPEP_0206183292 /NCGR_PEP_ID=MMETSP0166-20121206/551_1 /ASSEMBLY_ACC=CAM_ASM_000260 /TAXON_ID=95228 /ORGANISM="Vannella robusta, Strain DIVA3 518/3/11/1/6" /LENGTH=542 /DNA_ID=CAMNT_0053598119 /DNA_START=643 /DNA_END=2268 /DNA_ORIENTATION=+
MKDAALQPRGSIRNFVKYPVFEAYTEALLGRKPNKFLEFVNLPAPQFMALAEQRAWSERDCWSILHTKVCSFHTCLDNKKKEYVEYRVVCEIETENEDSNGIENLWVVCRRYSDFRNLQLQLKKLDSELAALPFPGRTFLPGRGTSQPIIEQRQQQLDEYLSDVIQWVQKHLQEKLQEDEERKDVTAVIALLDDFLEVSQLDRKPPCSNDKKFSCNMFHSGWFSHVWDSTDIHSLHAGFGAVNCEVLSLLVQHNKHIHTLDLTGASGGSLRNEGFRCLLQALASNETGVRHLYLGGYQGHNCDNEDIESLFEHNKTLESLYVAGGISISVDDPLLAFATRISSLVTLDLSKCFNKQPKAAQAIVNLVPYLKGHKNLRKLFLNENHIGNRGAELLSEALEENESLQLLSLRACNVGPEGLISLCNALEKNHTLQRLFVTDRPSSLAVGAPSSVVVSHAIAEMLKQNTSLVELDVSRQYLGDGCCEIVSALAANTTLEVLHLRNNRFAASRVMCKFFEHNQSVTSLDISHNDLTEESETTADTW